MVTEISSSIKAKPNSKTHASKLHENDPVSFLEQDFSSALLEMSGQSLLTPNRQQLRASSLPFCPIRTFVGSDREASYRMSHYTEIGTVMHENMQTWMSLSPEASKKVYGSWICSACGAKKLNRMKPSELCSCPAKFSDPSIKKLAGWPKFWNYEEVEFKYKNLTGHIDLIMWPKPDFAYVVDEKTTDLAKKKDSYFWKPDSPSSLSYIIQIRTYATILDILMGLPIKGWVLANVDRATPIKTEGEFHLLPSEWNNEKSRRWMKYLDRASDHFDTLVKLNKAVNKNKPVRANRLLTEMIEDRPCVSEKSYNAWMKYAFFGKNKCEFKDVCLGCNTNKIRNAIDKKLLEI